MLVSVLLIFRLIHLLLVARIGISTYKCVVMVLSWKEWIFNFVINFVVWCYSILGQSKDILDITFLEPSCICKCS